MKLLSTYPHGDDYSISIYETPDYRYRAVIRRVDGNKIHTFDGGEYEEIRTIVYHGATQTLHEARSMIAGGAFVPPAPTSARDHVAKEQEMIWKIHTCRGGTWTADAMPYMSVEQALQVVKRSLEGKTCDSAYLEDSDGNRIEWGEIKQKLSS